MGNCISFEHERFCKAACHHLVAGEKRSRAITLAYREVIYKGDLGDKAIAPNARRLADKKEVKARLIEMVQRSSELVGIDQFWAKLQLKGYVESADASYRDKIAAIALMGKFEGWEAPTKTALTDTDGKSMTLETLVGASMAMGNAV